MYVENNNYLIKISETDISIKRDKDFAQNKYSNTV